MSKNNGTPKEQKELIAFDKLPQEVQGHFNNINLGLERLTGTKQEHNQLAHDFNKILEIVREHFTK